MRKLFGLVKRLRRLSGAISLGLMVVAISEEMSKPEADRTWAGRVWGVVPYDFRPPTWDRVREAYWDPENPSLFTPTLLGVGWTVNLARAAELMRSGFDYLMATSAGSRPARARARKPAARP